MILTLSFLAAKSFGKFKDSFLAELHAEITSHDKQVASGHAPQPVQGIVVHDSEVLEPDPVRMGGLMRNDAVRDSIVRLCARVNEAALQRHTFKPPARPLEPPTPRTSILGLDKLAKEKRAAAAAENGEGSRKKARIDDSEPRFKGMSLLCCPCDRPLTSPIVSTCSPCLAYGQHPPKGRRNSFTSRRSVGDG